MSQVMEHVHQLSEVIGPRPATTDAEVRAADYIEDICQARGLEVERQEFDCPRSDTASRAVLNLLTVIGALLSIKWGWPALAISVAAAVLLWLDLGGGFSLAGLFGKGPSQTIIARHVPRQRRGDRLRRVVIIAHYDSPKSSMLYGPGLVKRRPTLIAAMKWISVAVPVVVAIGLMPFAKSWHPWIDYVAVAASLYLVFMLTANVQQWLLGHAVDGANDNASGVAAMLGVMEATVPEPDEPFRRIRRRDAETAYEAGVVPDEAALEYRPVEAPVSVKTPSLPLDEGFGEVDWDMGHLRHPEAGPNITSRSESDDWATDSDDASWDEEQVSEGQGRLALEVPPSEGEDAEPGEHGRGISAWLGVGKGFDVRKVGKRIGSWDNIASDDEDEFGFKAGTAGEIEEEAPSFDVAARIRRQVTENVDRALVEKEIWFVALGADGAGQWGSKAFFAEFGDELRDALVLNLEQVGAGSISFVTVEGESRLFKADRRLVTQAKRTVREADLPVKGASYRGFSSSATPALARKLKAMSVMAFDINGRIPNQRRESDVEANVNAASIDSAVQFVTALVRDL